MHSSVIFRDAVYEKAPDIVHRDIAGENLLVPIRGKLADMQRIYALNAVADFIWERIDGAASVKAISDAVVADFDTDAAQAATDVPALIAELYDAGLVVKVR